MQLAYESSNSQNELFFSQNETSVHKNQFATIDNQ